MTTPPFPRRVGCVPFLNARPLIAAFPQPPELAEPAVLSERLQAGQLDLALVPAFSALDAGWRALGGFGIACQGEVRSVVLIRSGPRAAIRSVALDAGSRTSANLLRLLFLRHWKQPVTFLPQGTPADAQLWIGDRALRQRRHIPLDLTDDLGRAWFEWTGLPFVFAVWALRPGLELFPGEADHFRDLFRTGLETRPQLAQTSAELDYLTEAIRYPIGRDEQQALTRFGSELKAAGLTQRGSLGGWL